MDNVARTVTTNTYVSALKKLFAQEVKNGLPTVQKLLLLGVLHPASVIETANWHMTRYDSIYIYDTHIAHDFTNYTLVLVFRYVLNIDSPGHFNIFYFDQHLA